MKNMQELLERTSLKAVGAFLLNNDTLMYLEGDVPAGSLIAGKRDNLLIALRKAEIQETSEINRAVRELEEAVERVGFCAGMKAGARLVLALTDGGDLIC